MFVPEPTLPPRSKSRPASSSDPHPPSKSARTTALKPSDTSSLRIQAPQRLCYIASAILTPPGTFGTSARKSTASSREKFRAALSRAVFRCSFRRDARSVLGRRGVRGPLDRRGLPETLPGQPVRGGRALREQRLQPDL